MAVQQKSQQIIKEILFVWEGKDKSGKIVKGEVRGPGEASVSAHLRRQGITVIKIKKSKTSGKSITAKDLTLFTRQLATMMKSGVPLLQSFDIVGKGHSNPSVSKLLLDIKTDVETGSSLEQAFRKFPLYFDDLFCNLVGAGRGGGYSGQLAGSFGNLSGKNAGDQEQDQISPVLSCRHHRGGFRYYCDHHDFCDSGIQNIVLQLWRRPARAPR